MNLVKEISSLKSENASLVDEKKKLYSDVASLSTASRIEKYAADTLGLKPVSAEKMLTLIKKNESPLAPDELELLFSAVKRVSEFLPVIEETKASARGVEDIIIDSTDNSWGIK